MLSYIFLGVALEEYEIKASLVRTATGVKVPNQWEAYRPSKDIGN